MDTKQKHEHEAKVMDIRNYVKTQDRPTVEGHDLLVFSHLRWDFVFQRPQHLMSRYAAYRRVYFIEEPIFGNTDAPRLHIKEDASGVHAVIPYLPSDLEAEHHPRVLTGLMNELVEDEGIRDFTSWYYTPMALSFTRHLNPIAIVYDCMDELSHFKGAPPALLQYEAELMKKADVVFTGGYSLYEAKQNLHPNIHPFPSSIDFDHFVKARTQVDEPGDQASIPHPRLGFFGVIDERMNLELLESIARQRPDWHLVMIGPVVKIDPADLPRLPNIHYLGKKDYDELPSYIAGWDLAIMPFALNDSTKFISPTKTPEFLAAGRPVVSTAIRDVVSPYGRERLVYIAESPEEFVDFSEIALREKSHGLEWLERVDGFLADKSWDSTWRQMASLESVVCRRNSFQMEGLRWKERPVLELV